jgi:hypothetical protein
MNDVVERILGYSNVEMVDYCETLKSIMTQTKQFKVGRGKSVKIETITKYKQDNEMLDRINRSIQYYSTATEFDFRDYQRDIITKAVSILRSSSFVYLAMEVRTGKTLTSLGIANEINAKHVLFITKKKAISSIQDDYNLLSPSFELTIINYESLHIVQNDHAWNLIILDEAHSMGAFPKPSLRATMVKDLVKKLKPKVILLSGTPTPESYSQMYHQVYAIPGNPFSEFANFYRFCDKHVKLKDRKINGLMIKDYSHGLETILEAMKPYMLNYTQKEAGFSSETTEEILEVELKQSTYNLIDKLKSNLVVEGKNEVILGDTPVKLMMKMHQLYSGTIKFESGNSMVLDTTKAEFIRSRFANSKIGIFYKFKEEMSALQQVFGADNLTTDLDEFNTTDKNIALQIVSGREGISLRNADYLVYYNIDFSATSYWQSKDRMTTKERLNNNVYWIFAKDGIEYDIYKAVTKKKDYTINYFKKQFLL